MSTPKDSSKEEKRRRKHEKKDKKKRKRERSVEPPSSSKAKRSQGGQKDVISDFVVSSNSPFMQKKASLMISLTPDSLSNTTKHIHLSMQSMLLKYSDGLGGVLISYDDIQLDKSKNDGSCGRIINEFPHIHYYITCDVLVFNPVSSTSLKGVVNEVFPSHVGLLVHELFNASISAEHLRQSGFSFDADLNEWTKDDTHNPICENDDIEVTVDKLHECNGLISLECKNPVHVMNQVHV